MISLPDKSDFANLREHTIELSSLGGGGLTAIKVIHFLQHPVNIGGASFCTQRLCLLSWGRETKAKSYKPLFLGNHFIATLSNESQIVALFNYRDKERLREARC